MEFRFELMMSVKREKIPMTASSARIRDGLFAATVPAGAFRPNTLI
jgi:hypothetical protein